MATTALGDYLRARRSQVTPQMVGLPTYGTRRVPGLRREEVAVAAGMSVDYYVRLEQGRESSPSAQVLDALARVMQLDDDARLHLYRVAGLTPTPTGSTAPEVVDPELVRLMGMWPRNPAIVLGRAYDVLAANPLAHALFGFGQDANLLASIFLDPEARTRYPDWEDVARYTVAGFRLVQGSSPDDLRVREIVERLSRDSPEFLAMWERHEARGARLRSKRFRVPDVGELTLLINAFDVRSAPGQELVVYHAEPGTPSEEALGRLAAIVAAA
jgi:transcriptional regulator with XRE-family HTH domain